MQQIVPAKQKHRLQETMQFAMPKLSLTHIPKGNSKAYPTPNRKNIYEIAKYTLKQMPTNIEIFMGMKIISFMFWFHGTSGMSHSFQSSCISQNPQISQLLSVPAFSVTAQSVIASYFAKSIIISLLLVTNLAIASGAKGAC